MIGKVNDDFFTRFVLTETGCQASNVIIGPSMGVDSAILKVPDGYMAIAEDPIFPSMSMTADDFAYVTVHIGASDVAVMGIKPQYMTYSLLLPPNTEESYIADLVAAISKYAAELGITIVGGHTGYYGSVTVPTIGGITIWGINDRYVSPKGAQPGDNIIITKGTGIEAAALLAFEFKDVLKKKIPAEELQRALQRMHEVSVVKDAMIAAKHLGVHAMHDATEGGVKRGVWEVAKASGVGVMVNKDELLIPADIKSVCEYFDLNLWEIISEGTLVLTCTPATTEVLLQEYADAGIDAKVIGRVVEQQNGCTYTEQGIKHELEPTVKDKFWDVFFNSAAIIARESLSAGEKLCSELKETAMDLCAKNIYGLIPEIGANIAYAGPDSVVLSDIAGIPGRIIRVKGKSIMMSNPELTGSTNMGNSLLGIRKHFPAAACVVNLRNTEQILNKCRAVGLRMVDMPVPNRYWQTGNDFFVDLDQVLVNCPELPDVITTPDRINLEKLILVTGKSLEDLKQKVLAINIVD